MRFSNEVIQDDVDEALRLVEASKQSLEMEDPKRGRGLNASSKIYNIVKGLAESGACRPEDAEEEEADELSVRKVRERVIAKGFTEDAWVKALDEYTELNVSFLPSILPCAVTALRWFELTWLSGLANDGQRHAPPLRAGGR